MRPRFDQSRCTDRKRLFREEPDAVHPRIRPAAVAERNVDAIAGKIRYILTDIDTNIDIGKFAPELRDAGQQPGRRKRRHRAHGEQTFVLARAQGIGRGDDTGQRVAHRPHIGLPLFGQQEPRLRRRKSFGHSSKVLIWDSQRLG